ncbi:helix-hairpin-helix domain-containing protein [Yaniella halotolerans]|uniref:helix-hairpin-helix domain-containing protein n=1 Tax=Yaniella halotolerans TaxID=225453 RepID=UPI0003B4D633|nr:helix-hairpin-helix domain-containing protein [Yaniella halotolerans]
MAKHLAEPSEHQPRAPLWRTKVALSAVLMLALVIGTIFGFRWLITEQPGTQDTTLAVNNNQEDTPGSASQEDPTAEQDGEESAAPDEPGETLLIVHVAGEVHEPGIVELTAQDRVVDAIEAAGGPTQQAQLDALNLAAVVSDGDYILVPDLEAEGSNLGANSVPSTPGSAGTDNGPVNLNTGDTAALETLPGVGPATAAEIIAHREQHGDFTDLASLEAVSGIGPATLERLDGLVSW